MTARTCIKTFRNQAMSKTESYGRAKKLAIVFTQLVRPKNVVVSAVAKVA
jgi:hypothetical protein